MCQTAKKAHVHLYYMYLRALLLTVRPTFTRAKPPIRKKKDHRLESVPKKSSHISKKVAIGSGMMTLLYCACPSSVSKQGKTHLRGSVALRHRLFASWSMRKGDRKLMLVGADRVVDHLWFWTWSVLRVVVVICCWEILTAFFFFWIQKQNVSILLSG